MAGAFRKYWQRVQLKSKFSNDSAFGDKAAKQCEKGGGEAK